MNPNINYLFLGMLVVSIVIVFLLSTKLFTLSKNTNQQKTATNVNSQVLNNNNQFSQNNPNLSQNNSNPQGMPGMAGFSRAHGIITKVSPKSLVMKADDNTTKTVSISADTRIMNIKNGEITHLTPKDLKKGEEVTFMGTDDGKGKITPMMIITGQFNLGNIGL